MLVTKYQKYSSGESRQRKKLSNQCVKNTKFKVKKHYFFLKFDEILGLKPLLKLFLGEILFIAIVFMLPVFKNTKKFSKNWI
jgi:hypothetical protein